MSESLTSQRSEGKGQAQLFVGDRSILTVLIFLAKTASNTRSSPCGSEGANDFAPRPSRYRARFLMGVFLLAGILLMLAHHSLHMFLDGKPVDSNLFQFMDSV